MDVQAEIYQAVLNGDMDGTGDKVQQAIDSGLSPDKILNDSLISTMAEVGRLFEEGEFFVPEMLIAARAMQGGLNILRPLLADTGIEPSGKVVMGTVKGDLHDIGKNVLILHSETAKFGIFDTVNIRLRLC